MKATLQQEDNRTKASVASFIFHAILLAMLFFYRFSASEMPPPISAIEIDMGAFGGGGDDAAAGLPDEGEGNDPAPQGDPTATDNQPADEPTPSTSAPATPPPSTAAPSKPSTAAEVPKNTPTTSDPNTAAVRQAEEKKRQEQQNEQRRQAEAAENERKRVAQEAADKARREQEERDKKKGQFGGTFGKPGATGSGQGNTGKPGNQGTPGGTGSNPFGSTSGTGGGSGTGNGPGRGSGSAEGFGNRRATFPAISDNSQVAGKVVIEVCVDASGRVISAESTSRGATTSNPQLRSTALAAARKTTFQPSDNPRQCGSLIFNFKLQ